MVLGIFCHWWCVLVNSTVLQQNFPWMKSTENISISLAPNPNFLLPLLSFAQQHGVGGASIAAAASGRGRVCGGGGAWPGARPLDGGTSARRWCSTMARRQCRLTASTPGGLARQRQRFAPWAEPARPVPVDTARHGKQAIGQCLG